MEAVYTLLKVDRAVPETWGSTFDVRELLRAAYYAVDKKSFSEMKLSWKERQALKILKKKVKGTDVEALLKDSGLLD
jgi:oleate hydratase